MIKLVVVDDQDALREGLVVLLHRSGIDVVGTAGGALAAKDAVSHSQPDVALISTGLPGGEALRLTRELLAGNSGLAVLLYSDDVGAESVHDGLSSGAIGYALKRGSIGELVAALACVAEGASYIDPRIDHKVEAARVEPKPRLSPREREVLALMAQGLIAEAVGDRLGVSVETVRTHTRNAVRKLSARNRVHAISLALIRGEIELKDD